MNRKSSATTPSSPTETPPSTTALHSSSASTKSTSPAAIIRQAYKYIIKFNKATTILYMESALVDGNSWWQLVADIVCIHKLGIVPLLMLDASANLNKPIDSTHFDRTVRLFMRHQQKVQIVYAQCVNRNSNEHTEPSIDASTGTIFTDTDNAPVSTANLFEQLSHGTIPIIVINANAATIHHNGGVYSIHDDNNVLSPSHLVIDTLCAHHPISKLICLTAHPFFPHPLRHSRQLTTASTSLPHTTDSDDSSPIEQPEHLAVSNLSAQWITQQPPQWHPLLRMIKFAATRNIQRMHIIAYNEQCHDSLLEELFSTKGKGFMVYTDRYATIRNITPQDITTLHAFYQPFVASNVLRGQSAQKIRTNLHRYYVYELDGEIVAACNCLPLTEQLYELGALATDPALHSGGLATQLLHHLCRTISEQHTADLSSCGMVAITTSAHTWFVQHGFTKIELAMLPQPAIEQIAQRNHREQRELGTIFFAPLNTIL